MAWFNAGEVPIIPKRFFIACISDGFMNMVDGFKLRLAVAVNNEPFNLNIDF